MPATEKSVPADEFQTAGELARLATANSLMAFASETLPERIDDADVKANAAVVDFDASRASLLRHAGVAKGIRAVASVAAQSQAFELLSFDYLWPKKYLDEIHTECRICADSRTIGRLESKADAFALFIESCPSTIPVKIDEARTLRGNTDYALNSLIGFCRKIVAEWFEVIPADGVRELLAELDRLPKRNLSARLVWFGLSDFAPTGELAEGSL